MQEVSHEDTLEEASRRPADLRRRNGQKPLPLLPLHPVKDRTRPLASRPSRQLQLLPIASLPGLARRPHGCLAKAPGGGERNRTDDLLLAKQALSQLSYTPKETLGPQSLSAPPGPQRAGPIVVGQGGFEPPTSRLSSARSNQLSY